MGILSDGVFAIYGLLILLILAPLPLGSNLPWAQSLLTFSVFALLTAWAVRPGISPTTRPQTTYRGLATLLALWALAVAFAFFQVLPLPPGVLAAMSPGLGDLYSWALPDYGQGGVWRVPFPTLGGANQGGLLTRGRRHSFLLLSPHGPAPDRTSG